MMISILIISIGSLAGALTKPVANKKWFQLLLITLMSMAVAVMIGDAVLHLFPHVSLIMCEVHTVLNKKCVFNFLS